MVLVGCESVVVDWEIVVVGTVVGFNCVEGVSVIVLGKGIGSDRLGWVGIVLEF